MGIPCEISSRMAMESIVPVFFSVIFFVLIVIHSIICFNTGIFPSPKESAHYRRLKLPWIESPYCLCIPTGCSIFAYQDNRSIVSAFAHPNVRVRESRICSLISPLAYIAHQNVMLSKTHPSTDIFDSANIWLGDAVISVISFSAYLWR